MKINNKMLEGTGEVVTGLNSDKLAGQSLEYFATRKEVDALNNRASYYNWLFNE